MVIISLHASARIRLASAPERIDYDIVPGLSGHVLGNEPVSDVSRAVISPQLARSSSFPCRLQSFFPPCSILGLLS